MRWHLAAALIVAIALMGCSNKEDQAKESQGNSAAPAATAKDAPAKAAEPAKKPADAAAKSVAAPAGGAIAKNFSQVKVGMSQDDVVKLLGSPKYQGTQATPDGAITNLMYQEGGKTYSIVLKGDKVANTGFGGNADEKTEVSADKVKDNFSKVKLGMSQQEVDDLLGQPSSSGGGASGEGNNVVVYTYEVGDKSYTIMFGNGKVNHIVAGD